MRDKLKEVIKQADTADMQEVFSEPANAAPANDIESVQDNVGTSEPEQKPLQGQLSIDDVQNVPARRPRPPRSCRRA